jgi:hypothetical protein
MSNLNGKIYGFTGLFPIERNADCGVLRSHLRSLDNHPFGSPLSSLDIVHMARFAIIDRLAFQGEPAKHDRLSSAYLLFACDFDGSDVEELVTAIVTKLPDTFLMVWGSCVAVPTIGPNPAANSDLVEYFRRCQVQTTLFLADQPDASVTQILRSLALTRMFAGFVQRHQGEDPALVQRGFQDMWQAFTAARPPSPGSW